MWHGDQNPVVTTCVNPVAVMGESLVAMTCVSLAAVMGESLVATTCVSLAAVMGESLVAMTCVSLAAMMGENLVAMTCVSLAAMMGVNPADFRVVAGLKATEAEMMGLVEAMEEMKGIAGVVVAEMTGAATMAAVVDVVKSDHLVVAGIWDADAILEVRDAAERFSRPVRSLKARSMACWNFIQGDMVFFATQNETTLLKIPTHLYPVHW
jgi:hypothetical protein